VTDAPHHTERGFTLLEVLVSLAILAGALTVMFQVFSRTLDSTADANARTVAANLAQSLLARIGSEMPLKEGENSGQFDNGFRWQIRMTPYDPDHYRNLAFVRPYDVAIDVSWTIRSQIRSIHLSALRLATAGAAR
jgi:general secretion pathway protein I